MQDVGYFAVDMIENCIDQKHLHYVIGYKIIIKHAKKLPKVTNEFNILPIQCLTVDINLVYIYFLTIVPSFFKYVYIF